MKKTRRIPNRFYGWLYIAPAFLLVIFLIAYPLCKTIDMSLRNVVLTNVGSGTPYNKFGNYIKLLNDSDLGRVLLNTIGFVVIGTGLSFLIGLGLALMVNHLTGGWRRLFSSYFLIPYIVPSIVLTLLWMWLFNPSYGVIDYLLSNAGILSPGATWFTDPVRSPVAILILYIYKSAPFHMMMIYAALQTVNKELYEAAAIDGGRAWHGFWYVTLPAIRKVALGLLGAVLCNQAFPGIRIFSTAYALPMAIASSSAAMIFKIMLHPSIGIVNKILGLNINWINDQRYALVCVAVLTAWLNSGINFLYFSAGLSNIDESIYERASVDGANAVQKFFRLTLPGLSPIMFYTLVVNIIQAFQSFGQVKVLTQGGPGESTNLIVYSIYRDAFFNYRFGSAAAQSVILFLIIMVLTLLMFRAEKKGVSY